MRGAECAGRARTSRAPWALGEGGIGYDSTAPCACKPRPAGRPAAGR
jgi:hypothetical protein